MKFPLNIEKNYSRELRKVAKMVGHIINLHTGADGITLEKGLNAVLEHYAKSLTPWAERLATNMLFQVNQTNEKNFIKFASEFAKILKSEATRTAVGAIATRMHREQVTLITSLPIQAGQRAQDLAMKAATGGGRAEDIAGMIKASGDVTASRANTIARTEIAKANASFTEARSKSVGADSYVWVSMSDENTRESHAEMDGKICEFDNPPTLSDGQTGNAGNFVNCRCFASPVISRS